MTGGGRLDQALRDIPRRYAGPGGAVAVLRDGEVLACHAWGWADAERRIPFTPDTPFLVCSVTKQFTCALLLDLFPDPSALDAELRALLPHLQGPVPGVLDLCHNQSGLRDYWAAAMLCGAPAEGRFGPNDARALVGRTRTLQFHPGTRYSYANQNFRLLSDLIERRTGQPFADLLRRRIFDRAGMPTAVLNPEPAAVPCGTLGYEGSVAAGFRAAVNRIHWTGDAGLAASLDDLIAWERHIDATRYDPEGLYTRLTVPVRFRDGTPASYGFGLGRAPVLGHAATSHGGGLRGWRSFRCYMPEQRVSAVVLFNHMADTRAAAQDLLAALLDHPGSPPSDAPDPAWGGRYLEPETGLAVRLAVQGATVRLDYGQGPDTLAQTAGDMLAGPAVQVRRVGGTLWMDRTTDNQSSQLQPCPGEPAPLEGRFHCAELDATLTCSVAGGVPYATFSGWLGQGGMQPLQPHGAGIWLLPCPRALDFAPPGDWTLQIRHDPSGKVAGVTAGCWLARKVEFLPDASPS